MLPTIKILSPGIRKIPHLAAFLDANVVVSAFSISQKNLHAVAGWGQRGTARKARAYAAKHQLPFIALEDGFLRSVDLGVNGAAPLSLVMDDVGIYYDATQPSNLEQLINDIDFAKDGLQAEALSAIALITKHNLSKYNHAPELELPALPDGLDARVLVVDQTRGDMSVVLGGGEEGVAAMVEAALAEHPTAQIIVKTHPDVLSGKKKGYLTDAELLTNPRVLLWAEDCSPLHLLRQIDQVYVYTSQLGFEALMLGKPVQCFGLPWYAGWGVTVDRHPQIASLAARRSGGKALWQLFAAAYLQYARYIHADTGQRGSIFDVIPWLVRNRAASQQLQGTVYCVGMSFWKQATVRPFLATHRTQLRFVSSLQKVEQLSLPADAKLLIWGSRDIEAAQAVAQKKDIPLWRMEDGFVRSVGLGSDLFRPLSLVVDTSGMYYDPHSNSDLEQLLATGQWGSDALLQAQDYITEFIAKGISKYNLGGSSLTVDSGGKTIVLIPGQVEDDASVKYGSPVVATNSALVQAVRKNCPDAYLIYKPHPDVVTGNRQGQVPQDVLDEFVDLVVVDANIVDCLRLADEVHTMSSLTGFEALLHGKAVHCYGGPFYAGWGLTTDHYALVHRQRRLSVEQLVYATIFQYPRYIMPPGVGVKGFAEPISVLTYITAQAKDNYLQGASHNKKRNWVHSISRKTKALWAMIRE
ncbi:capsular polysaccharide biosynthesis protein [Paenalcaligenes faecalis]|uniref:capsular polysaccharide biosynthesis protein n=1 Tax=Paenalcaligenes faecalis TaxID=2980099 RepID=UPI0022B9B7AC|nr:capsular polysaccharide biosynthesis protein [Paenalcaligenes faecalis]